MDPTITSPEYLAMAKAWKAKYPDRALSANVVNAYATAQVIAAAFQKISGNVEDKKALLDALYAGEVNTVRGPSKLDSTHEPVQNTYIYETIKQPDGSIGFKNLETHQLVPPTGSFSVAQLQKLKPGSNKGKWPGFTRAQLDQLIGG
jgi:branched-chain amino acid transport system substrate-binding protein